MEKFTNCKIIYRLDHVYIYHRYYLVMIDSFNDALHAEVTINMIKSVTIGLIMVRGE